MDNTTLQNNIQAARGRGVPENLIQARIKEIQASQPVVPEKSLFSKLGDIANQSFINPLQRSLQTIAGTPFALAAGAFERGQATPGPLERTAKAILPKENQTDPKAALIQQLKDSANLGSWAVPFGKGAGIVSKAIIPGAAVGGLQSFGGGGNAEDIIRSSLIGATTAGLLQKGGELVGKIPEAIRGVGVKEQKAGASIRRGVRQIKEPASIFGSRQEKEINDTLDKLKITGTPTQQYSKLESAMNSLEDKINEVVQTDLQKENPTSILKKDIKASFLKSLKSSMRSGELTGAQAEREVNGYLNDLIKASGGTGKFTNIGLDDLRNLKKLINEDYGPVHKALNTPGVALTPRQHVIASAWNSLDDAVKTASPEMKELLKHESNLYKSAHSLSAARFTPPVARVFSTSLPSGLLQTAQDVTGRGLGKLGKFTEKVGTVMPNLPMIPTGIGTQVVSRLAQPGTTELPSPEGLTGQSSKQAGLSTSLPNHTPSYSPVSSVTGYTLQQLATGKAKAIMAGDAKAASQIQQLIDIENSQQGKPSSAAGIQVQEKAKAGLATVETLKSQIASNPLILVQASIPGSPGARVYRAAISSLQDALGGLRTGASVSKEQKLFYQSMIPVIGDSAETLKYKFDALTNEFNNALQGSSSVKDQLPDITQQ